MSKAQRTVKDGIPLAQRSATVRGLLKGRVRTLRELPINSSRASRAFVCAKINTELGNPERAKAMALYAFREFAPILPTYDGFLAREAKGYGATENELRQILKEAVQEKAKLKNRGTDQGETPEILSMFQLPRELRAHLFSNLGDVEPSSFTSHNVFGSDVDRNADTEDSCNRTGDDWRGKYDQLWMVKWFTVGDWFKYALVGVKKAVIAKIKEVKEARKRP